MKIVICLGILNTGGAERVLCNLANYLVKENNEVIIIYTKVLNSNYKLDERVKVVILQDYEKKRSILHRNYYVTKKYKEIIINNKADLILSFFQGPIARVLFLKKINKKIKNIPFIVSIREDPKKAFRSIKYKMTLHFYKYADAFVFQTEEIKKYFSKVIQEKSTIIPNSINPAFFNKEISNIKREKKIVAVGRLAKQKNYPMLIDAFKNISKKFPDYVLEIYGDGELRKELENYINKLELNNKILLMGNHSNIEDKIYNASLFVITSNYEGISNALLEAMTLGLPCISTNSSGGGAKTLIENNYNGILIDVGDTVALEEKMEEVLLNSEFAEKLSNNAKKSMEKYHPKIINKMWLDYMIKVINENKNK